MPFVNLSKALEILKNNEAISYPTETFYGLGCLALESKAIDVLASHKTRDEAKKPFPLIIGAKEHLEAIVSSVSPTAQALIDAFWPGPLTLVLPAHDDLDRRIVGPNNGVAVRLSSHPLAQALARDAGQAIISTSANPPGSPPPSLPEEVTAYFTEHDIPILDGGKCAGGVPSTIVDMISPEPRILRPGAIAEADLAPFFSLS